MTRERLLALQSARGVGSSHGTTPDWMKKNPLHASNLGERDVTIASACERLCRATAKRSYLAVPEQPLWQALSGGKLGVYFRRQAPVGGLCLADSLAPLAKASALSEV